MSLSKYNKKRNFKLTPEPPGIQQSSQDGKMYLVQKHAASHLHYDFRLEINGALKSWAIPKGPCLDPTVKRLAVNVEDHPLEYGTFEGVIPKKQYGGGTVMLWDVGTWECTEDPAKAYKAGIIKFTVHGQKLTGLWQLVRLKSMKDWLLIKKQDDAAKPLGKKDILKLDRSVVSKRTMNQIAKSADKIWNSNGKKATTSMQKSSGTQISATSTKKSTSTQVSATSTKKSTKKLKRPFPKSISPQLAKLSATAPTGDDWLHEIKFDGYRIVSFIEKSSIKLITRGGFNWTEKFQDIPQQLKKLKLGTVVLDGEIVALDHNNKPSFQALQNLLDHKKFRKSTKSVKSAKSDKSSADKSSQDVKMVYYVFDILYHNGYDLTKLPLVERKEILKNLIPSNNLAVKYSDHIIGHGPQVFAEASKAKLEGIMSKKCDSQYTQSRNNDWLKVKCISRQEFVIGGYTIGPGTRATLGALFVGYYQNKKFIYCGRVGTGFTEVSLVQLKALLKPIETKNHPFETKPPNSNNAVWVKPKIVIEVEFREFTEDNILRHASFKGVRKDKSAKKIAREEKDTTSSSQDKKVTKSSLQNKKDKNITRSPSPENKKQNLKNQNLDKADKILTSPDKILYPEANITKRQIADYYKAVHKWMLPYIKNRPLSLLRCPSGWQNTSFFQKHFTDSMAHGIFPVNVSSKSGKDEYLFIKDLSGLVGLVQMGVLEIHPWGSQVKNTDKPDVLIFDLDPDPAVSWKKVVAAAFLIKDHLEQLNLKSFLRTTGGKGLHLVIPIATKYSWTELNHFAANFAKVIAAKYPNDFVATMSKSKRKNKIFIDYLRNGHGATAIGNYSTRARANAPVAVPLAWSELSVKLNPQKFTLKTVAIRLKKLNQDPWEGFVKLKQKLPKI